MSHRPIRMPTLCHSARQRCRPPNASPTRRSSLVARHRARESKVGCASRSCTNTSSARTTRKLTTPNVTIRTDARTNGRTHRSNHTRTRAHARVQTAASRYCRIVGIGGRAPTHVQLQLSQLIEVLQETMSNIRHSTNIKNPPPPSPFLQRGRGFGHVYEVGVCGWTRGFACMVEA
jgi:hypothetical protein